MQARDLYWIAHHLRSYPRSSNDVLTYDGSDVRPAAPATGGPSVEAGAGISRSGVTVSVNADPAFGTKIASNFVSVALAADSGLAIGSTGVTWVTSPTGGLAVTGGAATVKLRGITLSVDSSGIGVVGLPAGFAVDGIAVVATADNLNGLVGGGNADALHTHTFPAGEILTAGAGLSKTGTTLDANTSAALGTGVSGDTLAIVLAAAAGLELVSTGLRVLLKPNAGLQVDASGVSAKTDSTLTTGSGGMSVLGLPSLFTVAGVATLATVSAINLNTLTSSASNNADALHTHPALVTLAGAGLTKTSTSFAVNADAAQSTQIASNAVGVLVTAAGGIQHTGGGLAAKLNGATLSAGASGLSVAGVPSLFTVNGIAVSADVTAANLGTLTAGAASNADALHTHNDTSLAGSGLTKTGTTFAVNVAAANGTAVVSNNVTVQLATTPGLQLLSSGLAVLLPASSGLQVAAGGLSVLPNGATLSVGASGISVAGVPSLFTVNGVAVSANVTAANLGTLTAGATSDSDALHTHAGLATTAAAAGGLTKTAGAFSANVSAALGTQISTNTLGVKLATSNPGLQLVASGLSILLNGATLSAGASGLSVAGVPSLFAVNGVAVSANVTAANLTALTGGGSTALHTHALGGSLGGTNAAATVVSLDGSAGVINAAGYINFASNLSSGNGMIMASTSTANAVPMVAYAQSSTFAGSTGGELRLSGGAGVAGNGAVTLRTSNGTVIMLTVDPATSKMTLLTGYTAVLPTAQIIECRITNQAGTPATPTGEYVMYASSGALKGKGTSGTVTTIGTAEPHCPTCGNDFAHEWENGAKHLAVCMVCLLGALDAAGIDSSKFAFINTLRP